MTSSSQPPSLAEWAGGPEAFSKLFRRFYERVPADPQLAPVFAAMDPHHSEHVAAFVAQVLGGPTVYTDAGGSHAGMIGHHLRRMLTHEQRRAWIALLLDTADEIGMPDDPEFRASFVGYLEWGTRIAVLNSQPGVEAPKDNPPMPEWSWSSPGGPSSRDASASAH